MSALDRPQRPCATCGEPVLQPGPRSPFRGILRYGELLSILDCDDCAGIDTREKGAERRWS